VTKNDGWAFLPDDGRPDRLIRFVASTLDGSSILALFAPETNILYVEKTYYDQLDELDQGRVLATHTDLYVKDTGGRVSIR
jgi:hypothetical protein